jgi:hypothetical protein
MERLLSPSHVPWQKMSKPDGERLILLIPALLELTNGVMLQRILRRTPGTPGPMFTFVQSGITMYLHSMYIAEPPEAVPNMLRSIGRTDLAEKLVKILHTPVGKTSYRAILDHYRNKAIAHQVPFMAHFSKGLAGIDLFDDAQAATLTRAERKLTRQTAALYRYLRRVYPDVIRQLTPVDNRP